jgi:hypothetical protein
MDKLTIIHRSAGLEYRTRIYINYFITRNILMHDLLIISNEIN